MVVGPNVMKAMIMYLSTDAHGVGFQEASPSHPSYSSRVQAIDFATHQNDDAFFVLDNNDTNLLLYPIVQLCPPKLQLYIKSLSEN